MMAAIVIIVVTVIISVVVVIIIGTSSPSDHLSAKSTECSTSQNLLATIFREIAIATTSAGN